MYVEGNSNNSSMAVSSRELNAVAMKQLSEKFKEDKQLSTNLSDSVEIQNRDAFITTTVRNLEEAEALVQSTKASILTNPEQAILAHSRLS